MKKNILIGIQARSTSSRLPGKIHEKIGEKTVLEHVQTAAFYAQRYINRHTHSNGLFVHVAVLVPEGDETIRRYASRGWNIMEGPEDDVLSRYVAASLQFNADYIVRITADCPLIPDFLIQKHIKIATINEYDYCSNVYLGLRTALDGHDCEVISRQMLMHLDTVATGEDREHVTSLLQRGAIDWGDYGAVLNQLDLSEMKLSVDTKEDLERVRAQYSEIQRKREDAKRLCGNRRVHSL